MSAAGHTGSLPDGLAAAVRRVGEFLLEPPAAAAPPGESPRVVAVVALAPRCGTTMVARALASLLGGEAIAWEEARGAEFAERCRIGHPAVLEVSHGQSAGVPAALADQVVLVAGADVEPSLASSVARSLEGVGPVPAIVLNRVVDPVPWEGRFDVALPLAPWTARIARGGGPVFGELGMALRDLLDPRHRRHAII